MTYHVTLQHRMTVYWRAKFEGRIGSPVRIRSFVLSLAACKAVCETP